MPRGRKTVDLRGPSIPGYPSLTVGYPTEFQKGGIDIPPGVKMLGCQLSRSVLIQVGLGSCRNYGRQLQLNSILLAGMCQVRSRHVPISVRQM